MQMLASTFIGTGCLSVKILVACRKLQTLSSTPPTIENLAKKERKKERKGHIKV